MIKEFSGEYRWLSNFYDCEIEYEGQIYPSVEHAFQSAKCDDPEWKKFCSETKQAGIVKRKAKSQRLISDWDTKRIIVMRILLNIKFSKEPFKSLLKKTGDIHIQEGNNWGDTFWGVNLDTGIGKNILGKLIMDIRNKLKWNF